MANQLRKGVETLKLFYINKLLNSDNYKVSYHELNTLTLSELENLYRKVFIPKKNS
ncbi:Fur-regulated basic protein FbpA [Bacillus sp. MRMR6]|uniref:Fur-regulated basic protein FbpA n=1 Tax=Bacillus sp. MRMR6 TaxID=1928617 RepID=UPI0009F911EE|nr:Fur-regulated basic protein FbpA [Bacillus sp. MRMR6]